MSGFGFIPNPLFEEEVKHSADLEAGLLGNGEAVKSLAETIAPYDPSDEEPHIRESFEVEATEPGTVEVRNTSPHFIYVEFGTSDTPAQPSLGPALDAIVGRS